MIHLHNIILGFTPVLSDPSNSCADATAARAEIHLVKNIHFRSNIILYIIVDSPEPVAYRIGVDYDGRKNTFVSAYF